MAIADSIVRISNLARFHFQFFTLHDFERIVNVQLEIGHDGQMIPKLVLEIRHITQMRKHTAHDIDNRIGATLAFFPIFDSQRMIHHILDTSTVFGKFHFLSLGIIFHKNQISFLGCDATNSFK